MPKSNREYWTKKISKNIERDARVCNELHSLGWRVLTVWECELGNETEVLDKLSHFLAITVPA